MRILDAVGKTPMVRLDRISGGRFTLFVKLESRNPGGSVKDRPARAMVLEGWKQEKFKPGVRLLDATSGNTGIGYAWIGAALGIGVTLCVPKNASKERFLILRGFGVDVIATDPLAGTDGAQAEAKRIQAEHPSRWFYPDQYSNPANWKSHYETTGPEIWKQSRELITHFVATIGTTGTLMGTARYLRSVTERVRIVEVQPDSPFHGLEGIKHLPSVNVPAIYDEKVKDELVNVSTEESQEMVLRLAKEEGILAGPSGGANVVAALRTGEAALKEGQKPVVVTLLPDDGQRYLQDEFWKR